jgi:DedD protein
MEKKKLLLVAISVGVFLVIVIGASILVFSPRSPAPAVAIRSLTKPVSGKVEAPPPETPATVDAVDLINSFDDMGLEPLPEDETQGNVFYIYGENPSETVTEDSSTGGTASSGGTSRSTGGTTSSGGTSRSTGGTTSSGGTSRSTGGTASSGGTGSSTSRRGDRLIVDIPRPRTVAVPDAPAPAARQTSPARQTPAAPRQTTPAASAPAKQPASKARNNYWVQTGSFSTIARAEAVKETLSSKGINSRVENREMEGKTYFRVRVGPYTSKNEADYWLALVKSIHGFEESLVFQSPAP